ncbi:MAG: histidinol-phosphate transaminase [Chloroflexi bacterium AL-W]|nr:histidinol-phosphate transaminase [Chloroflexi bacterium AL-N1]NOK71696.1 histidinol-phosphate transaminase [Chloroflexi bacterium AL-N10]NOK79037.1 histidinol-phosphate transaminase [Chloroflexi bacterium AL-N5]NOK86471.1 histidinol-phosphate transaminase [Chloroflexi bacterium AL-W]NOK93437.1 histidinol-phosphate transaminase [Chloroflexi bacterium AL-N15]
MQWKEYISHLPPYKPPKLIAQQPAGTVKLSSNENPLGPSPTAIAAIQEAAANVFRYPDAGSLLLRQALADRYHMTPDMVMCTNGSDEMVFLLCFAFLREGDEAVMSNGSFISYAMRTAGMGATAVRVPLRDYIHDLEAMADAITAKTHLVFLCNPNNPTGTTNSAAEVARFLERVPDHVLVAVDEAYVEFVERSDYPDMLNELRQGRQNIVLLRTFAKIHGLAGLRLGYAFASPEVIAYLDRARPVFNVNLIAQAAGLAALDDVAHVQRSRAHAQACRAYFTTELTALGFTPIASETNFVAIDVGDDAAMTAALMERGFTVSPLSGWGLPGHIRISFGTDEENTRFFAALREVVDR